MPIYNACEGQRGHNGTYAGHASVNVYVCVGNANMCAEAHLELPLQTIFTSDPLCALTHTHIQVYIRRRFLPLCINNLHKTIGTKSRNHFRYFSIFAGILWCVVLLLLLLTLLLLLCFG